MSKNAPPFDGKPCPCCPVEIRGLYATAHNFVNRLRGRSVSGDTTLEDLEAALKAAQPLMDAHFADRAHSHGAG